MRQFGIGLPELILVVWLILFYVQVFLSYGTAYRKTKKNGDNGVSLFGWMLVYYFASIIPGLGIYLWKKSKEDGKQKRSLYSNN